MNTGDAFAHDRAKDAFGEAATSATSATSTTLPLQHAAIQWQNGQLQQEKERIELRRDALEQQLQQLQLEQGLQQFQLELAVSAAASAVSCRSEGLESPAAAPSPLPSDIVTLNVGGKLFSCQRRTLCLVKESLLDLMFSGRWPVYGAGDLNGNVFLDLDPELFEVVLNWLRRFNMSRTGNVPEPVIPEDKVAHMLAMLDYLQLHRHIPIIYQETFDHQHHSTFMTVHGATVTRTAVAAQHKGKHTTGASNKLMQFAVTDTAHSYFDMHLDITLEVLDFQDSVERRSKPQYMFIGFVHKAAAADLAPDGQCINSQLTKSPSCYGWLVGGNDSYFVRNGKRSQESCTKDCLLWNQGDQVVLTLDTRRDRDCASVSILNTVTGTHKFMDAEPVIGQSSSSGGPGSPDSSGSSGSPTKNKSRPGMRHRTPGGLSNTPGGVHRQEIMAILDGQPAGVNGHVAELVVGAAMQVLEAQGIDMQAAIDVLRQPGLVPRLVQQVRHAQQTVRRQAEVPRRQQQQHHEPAAHATAGPAAAADRAVESRAAAGVLAGPLDTQSTADAAANHPNGSAAVADTGQQQHGDPGVLLSNGCMIPRSSADFEWVLVVGMVQPKDRLRLISVKRRGQSPPL